MALGRPIVQTGLIGVLGSGRCAPRELRWRLAQKLALQHARGQFGDAVDQSDRARSRPRALKSIGLLRSRMLIGRKLAV
jgi:hypothetical protein